MNNEFWVGQHRPHRDCAVTLLNYHRDIVSHIQFISSLPVHVTALRGVNETVSAATCRPLCCEAA
jgi:hypothetical protein